VVVEHGTAVGQQLTVVVEQDDAVAEQAPALLGVAAHDGGEVTRVAGGCGARGYVVAHRDSIPFGIPAGAGSYVPCSSDYQFGKCAPGLKDGEVMLLTRSLEGVGRSCQGDW
jgi:hypothetical protein